MTTIAGLAVPRQGGNRRGHTVRITGSITTIQVWEYWCALYRVMQWCASVQYLFLSHHLEIQGEFWTPAAAPCQRMRVNDQPPRQATAIRSNALLHDMSTSACFIMLAHSTTRDRTRYQPSHTRYWCRCVFSYGQTAGYQTRVADEGVGT